MSVNPADKNRISAKIKIERRDKDTDLRKLNYYQKLRQKIRNQGKMNKQTHNINHKPFDMQKQLNHDEVANASYMVNQTNSNNTTINNNTLNNMSSHSKGVEHQMNPKQIPHGFYQRTYKQEKRIHYNLMKKHMQHQLKDKQKKNHYQSNSKKFKIQQYMKNNGPTL